MLFIFFRKRSGVQSDSSRSALQRAFSDITGIPGQLSGMSLVSHYLQQQQSNRQVVTLASAFIGRGKIRLSDFLYCVNSAQQTVLKYPTWNSEACKVSYRLIIYYFYNLIKSLTSRLVYVICQRQNKI